MAEQITIVAETRPGNGTGEARQLRREGRVPAVAYGAGLESIPVHVDALELLHALSTEAGENAIITLEIGGDRHTTLARGVHRHPVKRHVLHLDFVAVDTLKKTTMDIPLIVRGEVEGGVVNQVMTSLAVSVLPLEAPDSIEVSVDGLEIGANLRVRDLPLPEGVEGNDDPDRTAVTITLPELEIEEEPEEEELEGVLMAEGAEAAEAEAEAAEAAEGPPQE